VLLVFTVNALVVLTASSHPPEIVSRLFGPMENISVWMKQGVFAFTH
jgi:hypothetical protein